MGAWYSKWRIAVTEQHQDVPHRQIPTVCSFCEKPQDQVARLIGGPRGIAICNECVRLCTEILDETSSPIQAPPSPTSAPNVS